MEQKVMYEITLAVGHNASTLPEQRLLTDAEIAEMEDFVLTELGVLFGGATMVRATGSWVNTITNPPSLQKEPSSVFTASTSTFLDSTFTGVEKLSEEICQRFHQFSVYLRIVQQVGFLVY